MGREKLEQMKVTIATEVERLAVDVVIGNRSPVARAAISEELNDKISWMATQFLKSTKHPLLKKHREAIQKVIWDSVVEALVDGEAKAIDSFKNANDERNGGCRDGNQGRDAEDLPIHILNSRRNLRPNGVVGRQSVGDHQRVHEHPRDDKPVSGYQPTLEL